LDEEEEMDHSPLSNSVRGEDLPIDVDDGDPEAPLTPFVEPS
jgi:hypothetical protein